MQFRSYTYDSTEIDIQYALDSRGQEIREVQLDEAFTGVCFFSLSLSSSFYFMRMYYSLLNRPQF